MRRVGRQVAPGKLARIALAALAAGATSSTVAAQDVAGEGRALSPRNANYAIEVTLDPGAKILTGKQTVTWRNTQHKATDELWLHLYWNAWRNSESTWLREDQIRGRSEYGKHKIPGKDAWSYLLVQSAQLVQEHVRTDLMAGRRYAAPDDGNPNDRTVLVFSLPAPVQPGQSVQLEMTWRAKIPRTFARTGFRGDFFFIAHWFPKLGVFEPEGWNCHQYHAGTEFFSDYGNYDVRITLPERFKVAATGRRRSKTPVSDGMVTHRFQQADVHGFAWTASPDYVTKQDTFSEPGLPPVELSLFLQPEHLAQAARHLAATKATLKLYGTWYGPYPYGHLTIIDPAYGAGAGGMEYPTLFTAGTRLFNPPGGGRPEGVTVHEAGHQFWYGLVGNNEFEHAWIDEGINTFSAGRVMDVAFGRRAYVKRYFNPAKTRRGGFFPLLFPEIRLSRMVHANGLPGYRSAAISDAQSRPTFQYFPKTGARLSYGKTALWLSTLERYLGWKTLQRILSTFFERYRFKHPRPRDFFAVANEVSGRDLGWFFEQVYYGSDAFDYAVSYVSSTAIRPRGWVGPDDELSYRAGKPGAASGAAGVNYRTRVVVARKGGAVFPVNVLMVFDNGEKLLKKWDGKYRWVMFEETRPSKLDYAAVDPERVLLLDVNYRNNSRLLVSRAGLPATKWASKWLLWLQDFLLVFSYFV
ncbi:MAG: M1 family metallopeptidase [Proteobacteria bacterium]|nr:M1 family metallopeptidase [Pseudomonadota bacterium]